LIGTIERDESRKFSLQALLDICCFERRRARCRG
jgi:hypothetical protein